MDKYIVGGAVRDIILGKTPKDIDYLLVGATPADIQSLLDQGYEQVGKDFPVYLHPETKDEYALARIERKTGVGYSAFECYAGSDVTLEQDLFRRDLTINAMAMEVKADGSYGNLIDPFDGVSDLNIGILRHTSEAFMEDPVRVLRIARFSARYGFDIHHNTIMLMQKMAESGELSALVADRVQLELCKAMGEENAWKFFASLGYISFSAIFNIDQTKFDEKWYWKKIEELRFVGTSIKKENLRLALFFSDQEISFLKRWKFHSDVIDVLKLADKAIAGHIQYYINLSIAERVKLLKSLGVMQKQNHVYTEMFTLLHFLGYDIIKPFWDTNILRALHIGAKMEEDQYAGVSPEKAVQAIMEEAIQTADH